ncbi:DUF4382 domain-containing protein [Aureibaculum sp. 2210JD6-5]|uniref:DUF4382 domain-containing protein n=1 Tax=Aureibaculum sp. 2210JD6-5 TaxID=3103957 RepID=UPI002AAEE2CB|nr:DUF4382 domain-containing protein [Aureibaculum sp. 2210JD6-5]MDY7393856.1 DUF4382 domain-containing protein [Aureibaculum sp. 2210JD6-5]
MKKLILKFGILTAIVSLFACSDEEMATHQESQNTKVSITDAPIDNAEVSAAFVTISDVKVNGTSIEGFTKTTVDLMQLQNGNKKLLGNIDLNATSVSNMSLVLDYDQDVNGNAPGCYIKTANGMKHELKSSLKEFKIKDKADIFLSDANELVIDFNLRKTIMENQQNPNDNYDFVSNTEMSAGLRFVNSLETGSISGTVQDQNNTSDKIIVYAYKKGTYNSNEAKEQGTSKIRFANAVTSSAVSSTGNYTVSFLKEGDYEFHFASYEENNLSGEMEFKGMLEVTSLSAIQTDFLQVSSNLNLSLNVIIKGRVNG